MSVTMVFRRLRGVGAEARSAPDLFNAGNAALRQGRRKDAIKAYTAALKVDPLLPQAYHNRAIAHAQLGDETACVRDLLAAVGLEYDTDEFWPTFANHLGLGGIANVLLTPEHSPAYLERVRNRLRAFLQEASVYLREFPEQGVRFDDVSLPARALFASFIAEREEQPDVVVRSLLEMAAEAEQIGDPEFTWRAKFLYATLLYAKYQTTEWSPDGTGGVFFDTDYLENTPMLLNGGHLLDEEASSRLAHAGGTREERLARFALQLTFEAAECLLELRMRKPPPPGAANLHWALAQDLFKILVATAAYLDDDAALLRGASLSRRVNAAFGAAGWTQGRHPTDAVLRAVIPAHEEAEIDPALPGGTLALQYYIYETGGDNLLRLLLAGDTARRSYRYVHPPDVGRLLRTGRHWQDPHALAELRGAEGISDFNLLMNVTVAIEDVPAEGYGAWLDDLLLGEEFEALVSGVQRLVVLPFNYLHNIPFQHVPAIRRRIESGQLRELVVSPSLELTRRLSTRDPVRRDAASCLFVGINSPEVDADAEYEVVRSAFERTEALVDRRATPAAVAAAAARHDVLHVACHGDFDAGRNTTYLLLSDERLYPADLALIADLHCDTVVLNACVTGVVAREGRNGDQSLGMATALLYGGARQVIATLWQVEADPAVTFASRFWERWHGAPETSACGIVLDTQRELRRRYPTDIFAWGAHAVFGDWR